MITETGNMDLLKHYFRNILVRVVDLDTKNSYVKKNHIIQKFLLCQQL